MKLKKAKERGDRTADGSGSQIELSIIEISGVDHLPIREAKRELRSNEHALP